MTLQDCCLPCKEIPHRMEPSVRTLPSNGQEPSCTGHTKFPRHPAIQAFPYKAPIYGEEVSHHQMCIRDRLRKHKAQGDIAITDSEIATVEQWAKNLDSMTIKQYPPEPCAFSTVPDNNW